MSKYLGKRLTLQRLAGGVSMSKKSFIDSVKVGDPCSQKWEKMRGSDRVRFCDHCSKDVKNLSAITRKEAMRLVRGSDGNICIRYVADPRTKRPLFADQFHQITRRVPGLVAGVMTASLTLSTAAYSQSDPPQETPVENIQFSEVNDNDEVVEQNDDETPEAESVAGSIEGYIWDSTGKPVPGVRIMIVDGQTGSTNDYQNTDKNGHYIFDELDAGTYILRISSANGLMKKAIPAISLTDGQKMVQNLHVVLAPTSETNEIVTEWGYGGAIAMVQYSLDLTRAVADNDMVAAREILASGARVDDKDTNYDDITPLFIAVENGNVTMVKLLLSFGANVNAVDKTNRTPMMFMDSDATPELIEVLLKAGSKCKRPRQR